jgi:hypothetical protein
MAFLPPTSMNLTGGCLCRAIRYKINIPEILSRPLHPTAAPIPMPMPSGTVESKPTRLPLIELDHCTSCRLAAGSIIQSWVVCPLSWVEWHLVSKHAPQDEEPIPNAPPPRPKEEDYSPYSTIQITTPSPSVLKSTFLSIFTSSENVHRAFCSRCGTSLTYYYGGPKPGWTLPEKNFNVALGTLDEECLEMEGIRPERHGWWTDGIGWVKRLVRGGDGGEMVRHRTGAVARVMREDEG